jgi:hypothetical protein
MSLSSSLKKLKTEWLELKKLSLESMLEKERLKRKSEQQHDADKTYLNILFL